MAGKFMLLSCCVLFLFVYSTTGQDCAKPTIENGYVTPDTATIAVGKKYKIRCNAGYTLSGRKKAKCRKKRRTGRVKLVPRTLGTCKPSAEPKQTVKFRVETATTASTWAWDVKRVRVYDDTGTELTVTDYFDSGSVYYTDPARYGGYHVRQAFTDNNNWWGGRKNSKDNTFYLGGTVTFSGGVPSATIEQFGTHIVTNNDVLFQMEDTKTGAWVTEGKFVFDSSGLVGKFEV